MEIDSPDFDAESQFVDLISTNSLEELLNLEYDLTSEIKELDGSIQTLVYENYNKFISATDTIRSMKTNVESMESELHELLESMRKIDSLANVVEDKMQPNYKQCNDLVQINNELMQIKFICDLPSVLKQSIEQNSGLQQYNFENAAQSYKRCIDFLEEHKSDTQYSQIALEAFECTSTIRKMLWNKMLDDNPIEIVQRYTLQLIQFGDASNRLIQTFVSQYNTILQKKLKEIMGLLINTDDFQNAKAPTRLSNQSIESIEEIKQVLSESDYQAESKEGSFLWFVDKLQTDYFNHFLQGLDILVNYAGEQFKSEQIQFAKSFLQQYIEAIQTKFENQKLDLKTFDNVLQKLNEQMIQLDSMIKSTENFNIQEQFSSLFEFAIQKEVNSYLQALNQYMLEYIKDYYNEIQQCEDLKANLEYLAQSTSMKINFSVIATLVELEPLVKICRQYLSSPSIFVQLISEQLMGFFQSWSEYFTIHSGKAIIDEDSEIVAQIKKLEPSGQYYIALIKLINEIQQHVVEKIIRSLSEQYSNQQLLYHEKQEIMKIITQNTNNQLHMLLEELCIELIYLFIQQYTQSINALLMKYCDQQNWSSEKEPRSVSQEIVQIVELLKTIVYQLIAYFGDRKQTVQRFNLRSRQKHTMEVEMDRLYARTSKIFTNLRIDFDCILTCISKILFKSFYEYIRLERLKKGGFQQLQVDINFIKLCGEELAIVDDPALLQGLTNEVLKSGGDGVPLDDTVLESIIEHRKTTINL